MKQLALSRRYEHIADLVLRGLARRDIALELGLSVEAVSRSIATARRRNLLPALDRAKPLEDGPYAGLPRKSAIVRMAKDGVQPQDIAIRLKCRPSTVYHYLYLARRNEGFRGKFKTGGAREVGSSSTVLPRRLAEALRPAAESRGLTVAALAQVILARVVEDGLVTAVLDDAPDDAGGGAHV